MGERGHGPEPVQNVTRADRQIALVVVALVAGLYLRDVAPDLLAGDAGEFQFAAWQWGLAHPTGYPLYLLLGGLWQRLWTPLGVSPALALNALSAIFAGGAAGLFYLLLLGWLPPVRVVVRRLAAGLGVAMLVVNPTLRTQGIQAEIYTLHLLFIVAILLAAQSLVTQRPISSLQSPSAPDPRATPATDRRSRRQITLALLIGLALTHHATTLLLLPALLLYLWLADRAWWRPVRTWPWSLLALTIPLLLYLYIPLRAGPDASPWLHQRLGDGVLTLYDGTWPAFLNYVTGRAISVGFTDLSGAVAAAPTALLLWLRHFEWPGLLLMAIGLFVLIRVRDWPVLALTGVYLVTQQVFNLFYAIGDIFVYYIPAYLMACIWIAYAGAGVGAAFRFHQPAAVDTSTSRIEQWSVVLLVLLFWAPLQFWGRYTPLVQQVQRQSVAARTQWETVLAAQPPDAAILVSNDRDDLVPLFYMQTVEGRGRQYTGLFPRIAPDARFTDIGATVQTALDAGGDQPVFLVKPMPGLEVRFALAAAAPLVQVLSTSATMSPTVRVEAAYGPLQLVGYDWARTAEGADVMLHWRVTEPLASDFTATVQVFDAAGAKLGQDDRPPGGEFYPTSLWKPGEVLLDRRTLTLPADVEPATLLLAFYDDSQALLAAPLELPLALAQEP